MPEHDEKEDPMGIGEARGFLREIIEWVAASGKWWLIPILLGLLLVGALVVLGGTAWAPFIYPLF